MQSSYATLIPLAVFVSITLGTWVALGVMAGRPRKAEDRLQRLMGQTDGRDVAETNLAKRQDAFQARVTAAADRLGQTLRPSNEHDLGKIRLKLLNAGYRQEAAVAVFYGVKVFAMVAMVAVAFPILAMKYGVTQTAFLGAVGIAGLGFYVPSIVVDSQRKKRAESIFLGLPDALDLMVVCVEAGLGLDAAMRRVSSELNQSSPVLCEEFAIANFQLQMGRARREVLRDLGTRTGVEDVRALAAVIIQAEKFGSSIVSALRVQSDAMRLKRRHLAEERAAKTAVKIMIPLILFIFPGVFVVLVGPAGIQIYNMMSQK